MIEKDTYSAMRYAITFFTGLIIILTACQSTPQSVETAIPTVPTLQGQVDIITPQSGSIIYSEALYLQGSAEDVPEEGFRLRVVTALDEVLTETVVRPEDGQWLVELVHEYRGDPTEVSIYALPVNEAIPLDYDVEAIMLVALALRPEGVFGSIQAPQEGSTPGGDTIPVSGTASGVFENMFTVVMEQPDGTEISSVGVTMSNPYFIDEMVWETDLPTNDYTGPAVIRAYTVDAADGSEIELGRVNIMVSQVAG
jgi:hypothetical protein